MLKARPKPAEDAAIIHKLADTRQAFEEFSYIVAHDLNAPLRSIANFLQLLEERSHEVLDEKGLHYVDLVNDSCHKMQARIGGLLQYSRLNTVPLKVEKIDCTLAVEHALKQLRHDIEESGATVRMEPLPHLTADFDRLALLFYSLISNSLKFCRDRPVIEIGSRHSQNAWVINVTDNGIGIDPKYHSLIFSVFRRLYNDGAYTGIGMGLTLARRVAELHGGDLWVESADGEGASFYLAIPDTLPESSLM